MHQPCACATCLTNGSAIASNKSMVLSRGRGSLTTSRNIQMARGSFTTNGIWHLLHHLNKLKPEERLASDQKSETIAANETWQQRIAQIQTLRSCVNSSVLVSSSAVQMFEEACKSCGSIHE